VLTILLPGQELYDEKQEQFITLESIELKLEHSLVSLSKWESIHEKPFLGRDEKTDEEVMDYIRCMILTPDVSPNITDRFTPGEISRIHSYIEAKMTATWFSEKHTPPSREVITSELIYYWMIAFQIPMECENWHLNRLLTLVRVCNIKNQPPKKMSKHELARRNRELNAQRRAQFNTRG
jgi:hypothetical protein